MYRTLSAPITVQWEVTPACNHRCIHCYNYWRDEPITKKLSPDYKDSYQTVVNQLISSRIFSLVITGGEPLIVIEEIAPYIKQISDAGINVSMNTNLTLLTPSKARLLKNIGIKGILVSFPSADPKTCDFIVSKKNSLSKIIRGIRLAVKEGFRVSANMVVSKYNLADIEATVELAKSLGIQNFAVTRASNPKANSWFSNQVIDKQEFLEMQKLLKRLSLKYGYILDSLEAISLCAYGPEIERSVRNCSAGKSASAIGFDGAIRACIRLEKSYGNILDGLDSAWKLMDEARNDEWLPLECEPCKLKSRCGGGCRADALVASGKINGLDNFCNPTQIIPEIHPTPIKQTDKKSFRINKNVKTRPEEFGGIIYQNTSTWIPVNKDLLKVFNTGGNTTIDDLMSSLTVSETEAINVASFLSKKGFIYPDERR